MNPETKNRDFLHIPTLPRSVARLQRVLADADASAAEIADVLGTDPPLTAKVLQIANSVQYARRSRTTSIQMAVSVLGTTTLLDIVMRASLLTIFGGTKSTVGFSVEDFWKHSILAAHVSEHLATLQRRAASDLSPQEFYVFGLLHDVGKIILYDNLGDEYVQVLLGADRGALDLQEEESIRLGMNHAHVGSKVAKAWHLPPPIPQVIHYHHRPVDARSHLQPIWIVACAEKIAKAACNMPKAEPEELVLELRSLPIGMEGGIEAGIDANSLRSAARHALAVAPMIEI